MIHQLQFGSNSTGGPVLVPVDLLSGCEPTPEPIAEPVFEPIQLNLMLSENFRLGSLDLGPMASNRSELGSSELGSSELDSPEPDSLEPDSLEPNSSEPNSSELDSPEPDATELPLERAPEPKVDVSRSWPIEDWGLQSVVLDGVGATHYVVGDRARRRSSPPLELIGVGVLGATLLSGFAIADNAKQVAQTPGAETRSQASTGGTSRGDQPIGSSPMKTVKSAGSSIKPSLIQPSSIQPEMVRPEMALPPPPVMVSKNLGAMAGLSVVPMTAVTSTTGSMTVGSMGAPLGLTTAPRSLRPVQLAEPTLVSVARSQGVIQSALSEPSALPAPPVMPSSEPIAEAGSVDSAVNSVPSGVTLADRPMVSQVLPGWSPAPEPAIDRMPVPPMADQVAPPMLSPSGVPLADPVLLEPQALLGEDSPGAIPLAVTPPGSFDAPSGQAGAGGVESQTVVGDGQGVRSLSQAEAMAVLGARSESEMGRFIHQSLNARDYAMAVEAQNLGMVPPFGFVDYQNQRIVLPSDLTAAVPGGQLQSMGEAATTVN